MNRNSISHGDIKVSQILSWFFSTLMMISMFILLFFDFSIIALFITLLALTIILLSQYYNSKAWNIWYEGDELFFENIYKTNKRNIDLFEKIEQNGVLGFFYSIHLNNGEVFRFRINPLDDLRLFFNNDKYFYVNKMNEKIKDYIRTQKGHILLD
jgi:hypothetical protein